MTSIATASSMPETTQYVEININTGDESVDGLSNVDDEHPNYPIKGMFFA